MILPAVLRGYQSLLARGAITIDQIPEPYRSAIVSP